MAKSIYMVIHHIDSHLNEHSLFDGEQQRNRIKQHQVARTDHDRSMVIEDSKAPLPDDEDDEYSCNSSSECGSEPQLLDEEPVESPSSIVHNNHPISPFGYSDSDDLCSKVQSSLYESGATRCKKEHYLEKIYFCWLPNVGNVTHHHSAGTAYAGISHNPPMVCSEGVSRGNVRLLHRKAWLEVSDAKHRYGKHLRMYHRHWESLFASLDQHDFFDWLDSKGSFAENELPEIPDCLRCRLDSDTVKYIDDRSESGRYAIRVVATGEGVGMLLMSNNVPAKTGPSGWMFVLRDNVMYVAPKVINNGECTQRFHHSSFFGGRAVQAAGIVITDETTGHLQQILPHSGHYRPGESDVQRVLFFLHEMGIRWNTFSVDVQQFLHIDRSITIQHHHGIAPTNDFAQTDGTLMSDSKSMCCTLKKKKVESLHLRSALTVADFLSHKARCLQPRGIFAEIEAQRGRMDC
jgi:hypothetical protein